MASLDEHRVAETRARAPRPPAGRERTANLANGALVLAATLGLALLGPGEGGPALATVAFVVAYACAARVEFEVNAGAAVPTQLVFVPMLLVLPPAYVPLAVAAGLVLSNAPAYVRGRMHPERALAVVTSSAYAFGPALVLLAYGSQPIGWEHWPLYVALVAAQGAADFLHTTVRERIVLGIGPRELLRPMSLGLRDRPSADAGRAAVRLRDRRRARVRARGASRSSRCWGCSAASAASRIDHALELDGAPARERAARPARALRPAHRPRQPPRLGGRAADAAGERPRGRAPAVRRDARPRPLQALQRRARPPGGRRRCCVRGRRRVARGAAPRRPAGAHRRRGVRPGAAGLRPARRPRGLADRLRGVVP